jgi:aminoglycoside phosphotransferase (APT) family kinase protein
MMRPPTANSDSAGLLDALKTCGLLGTDDHATLSPLAGGVSSDVYRVEASDGRVWAIKRSIPRLRVAAEWLAPVARAAGEVRWLRLVRQIDPRLAPEVVCEVPEAAIFAMRFLDPADHPVWKEAMAEGQVDPTFAEAVGRDLAKIHAATAGRQDVSDAFPPDDCFFALRVSPFLLFTAGRHPDVAPRLEALASDLVKRRIALVHGDVSPKNILIGPLGPVFLDAECVTYGDPAFDLAFCLSHLLLKTVWLAPHREAVMASFERLRAAYIAGADWEARGGLDRRAAALVGALLLARVDGKSPAPYLVAEADKALVRRQATALLSETDLDLDGLAQRWRHGVLS